MFVGAQHKGFKSAERRKREEQGRWELAEAPVTPAAGHRPNLLMDASAGYTINKKKRKITELITIYEPSKAPIPPPLESSSLDGSSDGSSKRKKTAESSNMEIVLPPPPAEEVDTKRALKKTNSRPKLSSLSTSERRLRERQRTEAANEILSSEKSYVASLESFVNVRPKAREIGSLSVGTSVLSFSYL